MKKIKLKITGGGLDGFSKFNKPETDPKKIPLNPALASYQDSVETDRKFRLLNENALKGILFFLAGEQKRVVELSNEDVESAVKSRKCVITRQPFFEMFATRYKNASASCSTWQNGNLTLSDSRPLMALFEEEINQAFGTSHLQTIYDNIHKKQPSFTPDLLPSLVQLQNKILNLSEEIRKQKFVLIMEKRIDLCIQAINSFMENPDSLENLQKKAFSDAFINEKVVVAWDNIINSLINNPSKRKAASHIKDSSLLMRTPKWPAQPPALTTGVGYLLKVDFDVYLDVSDELFIKLLRGPGTAHWAHHGLVEWSDVKDKDMPEENELDDEVYYNIPYTQAERKEMAKKEKIECSGT